MRLKHLLNGNSLLRFPEGDPQPTGQAPPSDPPTGQDPPSDPPAELPPLIGDDLGFAEGWQSRVGEEAEGLTFKDLTSMAKSAKEAQRTITQLNQEKVELTKKLEGSGIETPKELPADAAAFKEQLELPEMPEGVQLDDAVLNKGIEYAMEKGYGPKELADFLSFDLERAAMEAEASKNELFNKVGEAKKTIIEAVGEQNYETTVADAKFVSETLGLPLEAESLVQTPDMVIALSKLRESLSEGTLKGASVGGVEITSGSKLSQAEDIVGNTDNPLNKAFYDPSHPQHEQAIQTHARLISESAQ